MEYDTGWWFQPTYPSEKWWNENQLGWRHSQVNGKMKFMFQTTNQKCAMLTRGYHQVFPIIWLVFDAIEPPRFWSSGLSGPHFRTPATPPRCNLPSEAQQVGPKKKVEWNPWHIDFDRYQLQTAHHFDVSVFFGVCGWMCWGGHVWLERCWSLQKIWKKKK